MLRLSVIFAASLTLQGCIARTAVDLVTAPVRAAGQVVDWTTTSQDEADRELGRKTRQREEDLGRLERRRADRAGECQDGNSQACRDAVLLGNQIEDLRVAPLS